MVTNSRCGLSAFCIEIDRYPQHGDTRVVIQTRTVETYDASKKSKAVKLAK